MTRISKAKLNRSDGPALRPLVSIMIPCLNEEESLTYVIPGLIETLSDDEEFDYELVLIDDGSDDQTPEILTELCRQHENIKAIRLGRNCGSHTAYRAGLEYCSGDAIAFAVADLQEGPELIRQTLELWRAGAQVVGTIALGRDRGGLFNELGARVFYWLRQRLARNDDPSASHAALRVIDRQVADHCRRHSPRVRNLNTWVFEQPFSARFLHYTPTPRKYGKSRWTLRKKLQLALDTLLDSSPLFLTGWLAVGGLMLAGGGLTLATVLVSTTVGARELAGMSAPTVLGAGASCTGLILMATGMVGTYMWRIYQELRGGPGFSAELLAVRPVAADNSKERIHALKRVA